MPEPPTSTAQRPTPVVLIAVGLLAGSTLGLQVALTRHFSYLYWHHFAFMIIGVGLLGFGAAGAWLARGGGLESGVAARAVAAPAAVAAAVAVVAYLLIGPAFSFEPLALFERPRNFLVLLLLYGGILLPFTGLGLAQSALLAGYRTHAHRIYAADLLGAGIGCLATLGLLELLSAPSALLAWGACAALGGALLARRPGPVLPAAGLACAVSLALLVVGWADGRPFVAAPSKDINTLYLQRPSGPVLDFTTSTATMRLDVSKPFRMPFGFGGTVDTPREQRVLPTRAIFQDGAAPTFLYHLKDIAGADFLGRTSQGLAYQIRQRPRVVVIGAGGGPDVLIALHSGAASVTAVELNPQMLELGRDRYRDFAAGLYQRPEVRPVASEGRHFLGRSQEHFDIVQMSGVDTFAALASGAHAMSESYLYTVEAGVAVLDALEPDGLFSNSRWILEPPRESLRLVAVLAEALKRHGAENPAAHLFVVKARAWATTLVSRRPFSEAELLVLRRWVGERGWRVVLDPDGSGSPPFVSLVHGTAAERADFLASYRYDVTPVSDDGPFFFQFYRWSNLLLSGEASRGGYSITRVPAGLAILGASLVQMSLLAAVCIFGPLWSRRSQLHGQPDLARRFAFFAALGGGFMVIEITAIQAFTVFLGHPIYSMAITLASLLVATGLGSALAGHRAAPPARVVRDALIALSVWVLTTIAVLHLLLDTALGWPLLARGLLVTAWLLPAGLALGAPFPTAVRALEAETPALVPWAWGTNACCSVIASVGSVLLAMEIGFRATLALALILYWAGYAAWATGSATRARAGSGAPG